MLKFLDMDRQISGFDEISHRMRMTTEIVMKKHDSEEESEIMEKAPSRDKENEQAWKVVWEEFMNAFLDSKLLNDVRIIFLCFIFKEIESEKRVLAQALTKVDELVSKESTLKEIINKEEVVKKLINFVIDNDYTDDTKETIALILDTLGYETHNLY